MLKFKDIRLELYSKEMKKMDLMIGKLCKWQMFIWDLPANRWDKARHIDCMNQRVCWLKLKGI